MTAIAQPLPADRSEFSAADWIHFWGNVEQGPDCWRWKLKPSSKGYGRFGWRRKVYPAHRVSYWLTVGDVPVDLTVDHRCRNRMCVNPTHLRLLTVPANVLAGESPMARNARKTHCPAGHPYDEANTYVTARGERDCRACGRELAAALREARRAALHVDKVASP